MLAKWSSILGLAFLCIATAAAFYFSVASAGLARMIVYDYNHETMALLSPDQKTHLMNVVQHLVFVAVWPLFFVCLTWMVAFFVVWAKLPPKPRA